MQARNEKNKDEETLPQINHVLIFGEESGIPFYYRILAGNNPDVKRGCGYFYYTLYNLLVKTLLVAQPVLLSFHGVIPILGMGSFSYLPFIYQEEDGGRRILFKKHDAWAPR